MSEDGRSQAPTAEGGQEADALGDLPEGMTRTENGRPCLAGSGSACLDFFFHVVPGVSAERFEELVAGAWADDAGTCLQLIFQTGNCRRGDGGKLDRTNFHRGLLWLWREHPATLLANLDEIVRQGCWKDLLDLLHHVLDDGLLERNLLAAAAHAHRRARCKEESRVARADKVARQAALKREFAAAEGADLGELWRPAPHSLLGAEMGLSEGGGAGWNGGRGGNAGAWVSGDAAERFRSFCAARDAQLKEEARERRRERGAAVRARVEGMSEGERALYGAVAGAFARGIAAERAQLASGARSVGGLCCKWAPTPDHMHDKGTLLVDAIIALLPAEALGATRGSALRIRYQQALAEVRRGARIPEAFVGRREFGLVDYARMPSLCRKAYGERTFRRHDAGRYDAFLEEAATAVREGRRGPRVHSGALLPHHVTEGAGPGVEADLQWAGLVGRVREARAARGGAAAAVVVPVCDVSWSMSGRPMEVAIALSLLLAESAPVGSAAFGRMFTFHERPSLLTVPGVPDHAAGEVEAGSLARRVAWVRGIEWGGSTDLDAVLGALLALCVERGVGAEEAAGMAVCVLSDMQFNEARGAAAAPWETAHEANVRRWRDAGYPTPPTIVYWNLRAPAGGVAPAGAGAEGVVMLGGFSAGLLEAFLAGRLEAFTPAAQMRELLDKPCYARLRLAPEDALAPEA